MEKVPKEKEPQWKMHVDGASNAKGCGAGIVITSPEGNKTSYALRFEFQASNNEAEYEALVSGLKLAKELRIQNLLVHMDSNLVVQQVKGEYEAKEPSLQFYLARVKELQGSIDDFEIVYVPRRENKSADTLSRIASSVHPNVLEDVYLQIVKEKASQASQVALVLDVDTSPNWMTSIVLYLTEGKLLEDKLEAQRVRCQEARYSMIDGVLYRKSLSMPYLMCLTSEEAQYVVAKYMKGFANITWEAKPYPKNC